MFSNRRTNSAQPPSFTHTCTCACARAHTHTYIHNYTPCSCTLAPCGWLPAWGLSRGGLRPRPSTAHPALPAAPGWPAGWAAAWEVREGVGSEVGDFEKLGQGGRLVGLQPGGPKVRGGPSVGMGRWRCRKVQASRAQLLGLRAAHHTGPIPAPDEQPAAIKGRGWTGAVPTLHSLPHPQHLPVGLALAGGQVVHEPCLHARHAPVCIGLRKAHLLIRQLHG